MFKRLCFGSLLLVFILTFSVSCHRRHGYVPGKINLFVLNYMDLTSPNVAADIEFTWNQFLANNPDVVIHREDLFGESFHQKVEAYAASGNMPDVLYVWPSGRSTSLHQNRLLRDLTPFIERDGLRDYFLPAAFDPANHGGGYVAMLPMALTSTHVLFVNKEVLEMAGLEPARTYEELRAQAPILRAHGLDTLIMPNRDSWVMQSCLFSMLVGRFFGLGWEHRILNGEARFTDPDFVQALDFVRQMYADGVITTASLGISQSDSIGMFATNRGAYLIAGDWRAGSFLTDRTTGRYLISPERQKRIHVTVFPYIEGAKINRTTSSILGVGWAMSDSVPPGSPREEAAWQLIKWLTGREATEFRIQNGAIATPVRTDIDFSELELEPLQIAIGNLRYEYDVSTSVIDGVFHSDVFNPLNNGLAQIGLGTRTPEQVAADIQRVFDNWKQRQ